MPISPISCIAAYLTEWFEKKSSHSNVYFKAVSRMSSRNTCKQLLCGVQILLCCCLVFCYTLRKRGPLSDTSAVAKEAVPDILQN